MIFKKGYKEKYNIKIYLNMNRIFTKRIFWKNIQDKYSSSLNLKNCKNSNNKKWYRNKFSNNNNKNLKYNNSKKLKKIRKKISEKNFIKNCINNKNNKKLKPNK